MERVVDLLRRAVVVLISFEVDFFGGIYFIFNLINSSSFAAGVLGFWGFGVLGLGFRV